MREHNGDDPKFAGYGIDKNGIWEKGHALRMIRSGAAALLIPDAEALTKAYGGVPIYPTYSMSEQVSDVISMCGSIKYHKPCSSTCYLLCDMK